MSCALDRDTQGQVLEFSLLFTILLMRHFLYGGSGDMVNNFANELKLKYEDDVR